ncbi:polyferredoxin [Clostridium saccharoperbutylacetonicum]|uniref:4Fe-4S binding domain/4Fe-4S dicluster domain-containing n=1 Tax=Clostridium saccharoperbutylacetonicum N1-4(HMT) TaxID=931276 RepID=M1MBR6_9CLOT|nr:4Fe-4S binding protein [Clostridium saccharoperbutylacetonicum]AGF55374.1 4Fe-4S binding domain/4Fe-4S dicluster domain-containing [Clostridium saccharoperbutylacetonicum N1-4(HMT)]NRT63913.1 polyferredoxin [Clostridium saccharoperbutylacetonicum]NSB27279.1 polyferredoxin [Clostridium saccharoperbutylacetonicum]NSB40765.1 polyferredoxin [Clostridium saccharoperbutylacetonicum]
MKRQNVRKLFLISSMLLFPITIYYFSPYLIIQGALEGVINGSFIIFLLMLISSVFLGRAYCGYLCPVSGIQECTVLINDKKAKQGWKNNIKYVIWLIWIIGIILCFVFSKQKLTVDFFYMTDHGISISNIYGYIIYYLVILLVFIPSVLFGKRIFCHYFCWMAPFMVIGNKLGNLLHIKKIRLEAHKDKCINCHICDKSCPMSLNVSEKVNVEKMEDSECILCGACVDSCPKKAITYKVN